MLSKNKKGFTLIENLVSILLVTLVLTGGIAFYFNSSEVTRLSTNKKVVMEMMNKKLEELIQSGYSTLPEPGSSESELLDDPNEDGMVSILAVNQTVETEYIDDPVGGVSAEDYKKVEIKGVWTESGKGTPREVKLTTYIAP